MVAKSETEQSAEEAIQNKDSAENSESEDLTEATTSESPEAFEEIEVAEALDVQPDAISVENFKTKTKNFVNKKEEKIDASKASSKAKFKNADPEVDLDYTISGLSFKENIILNKKLDFNSGDSFNFEFKTNGLKLEKDNAGNLNFVDENGKIAFSMPKGSMWDSGEGFSNDVNYEFKENENGYIIFVIPNYEWINSAERVFPIFIDPPITLPYLGDSSYEYTVTDPYNPNTNSSNHDHIPVGTSNANYQSFLRYTALPNFSHGEMVTDAAFEIALPPSYPNGFDVYFGTLPMQACARSVTSAWQASTLTYANRPSISSTICDYFTVDTVGKWYDCDITKLTKDWYSLDNPNSNFGFELDTLDPSQFGLMRFISKNTSSYPGDGPRLTISYRNFIGEEPYWSYTGHNAGLNGYGKVNNYAGTLSASENILSYSGSRNPISVSNSYNGPNYNDNANTLLHMQTFAGGYSHSASMGLGWSLDFNQLIYPLPEGDSMYTSAGGNFRYLYIDDDGTWHYFKLKDNKIVDEDGLSYTINEVKENDIVKEIQLVDKGDNKLIFKKPFTSDICYALNSSVDYDGNKTEYFYEYQPGTPNSKVSRIKDNASREIYIAYDRTQNMITEITEADGKKTTFTYDGQKLTEINYADGLKTGYVYDAQGRLSKVWTNEGTGSSVVYQYISSDPRSSNFFKVKSVTEFGSQNADPSSEGNSINFNYSMNQTDITRKINNLDVPYHETTETWQFDHYGLTTAIVDENGNMVAKYYENTEDAKKNKVKHANDTGKYTNNLLKNTAATNGLTNWTISNGDQSYPARGDTTWDISTDTSQSYLGTQSFKIKQSCSSFPILEQKVNIQKLSLPKKYTLSGYVKVIGTLSDGGDGASLRLAAYDGTTHLDGDTYSESIYSTDATASIAREQGWRKISVTFTVPAGADTISCCASSRHSNGEVYFDCFQLEEGEFANDYNAVENSSFDSGLNSWTSENLESGDSVVSGRVKITGNPTRLKNVYQIIPINKVNPVLAIRATAQGTAAPNNSLKNSGLTTKYYVPVLLTFSDSTTQPVDTYFNPDVSDTQSLYASICASDYSNGKTLTSVRVGPSFHANCNTVYFDNIQVCFDDSGVRNEHNDKGSIVSMTDNTGNKTGITRDTSSDEILEIQDSRGYKTNFSYENSPKSHQMKSCVIPTPGGRVKNNFVHDDYGNVTGTQTQDEPGQGKIIGKSIEYTDSGNYRKSTTDSCGKVSTFNYNELNGNLNSDTDPTGVSTNYTYDAGDRVTSTSCSESQTDYTYSNGILSSVAHKLGEGVNVAYNFARDIFGKVIQVKVGDQILTRNTYDAGDGLLKQVKFANNQQVQFDYDKFGRLIKKHYHNDKNKLNGGFEYVYDNKNRLVQTFDEENNLTTKFEYDTYGRIAYLRRSDGVTGDIKYNPLENLVDKVISKIFGISQTIENTFGASNKFENSKITIGNNSIWYKHSYDTLGRIQSNETLNSDETTGLKHEVSYVNVGANNTANLVNSVGFKKKVSGNWVSLGKELSYEYDDVDNISIIKENGTEKIWYFYDGNNQLIRENNLILNKTIKYSYDLGGNIQEKKIYTFTSGNTDADLAGLTPENKIAYGYADSNWKDKMTSYNNQSIIYDGVGNPVVYRDGLNFEWTRGRKLDKASNSSYNVTCKYDDAGIRTQKIVNDVTTNFVTSGIQILAQKCGDNVLTWQIAGNGVVTGFDYNGTSYFYIKNTQDDIIGITDTSGNIVAEYVYDSWGKILSVKDANGTKITDPSNIALINPLRYRGYYYDSELRLYYLNARYYDPETGRFISADDEYFLLEDDNDILDYNVYTYCQNNPMIFEDPTGKFKILNGNRIQITKGDTLWGIAKALTGNGANWKKLGYKGNSSKLKIGAIFNARTNLPKEGKPNSKDTLYNPDGTPKQDRTYGPDGKPVKDKDYNHGGKHHKFPHEHKWKDGVRGPAQNPEEITRNMAIALGAGYLIYRGVRILPSLVPALWWTLPLNVVTP